jgi:hypothetical protein
MRRRIGRRRARRQRRRRRRRIDTVKAVQYWQVLGFRSALLAAVLLWLQVCSGTGGYEH